MLQSASKRRGPRAGWPHQVGLRAERLQAQQQSTEVTLARKQTVCVPYWLPSKTAGPAVLMMVFDHIDHEPQQSPNHFKQTRTTQPQMG